MQVVDINTFLENTYIRVALTLLGALVVQLVVQLTINRIVSRAVHRHRYKSKIEERKRANTLSSILRTASGVIIWIIAAIIILGFLHVNVTALVTGAGLFGVIIGFGAQNTLKDYLAGIFIIVENQYRVGDIVTLTASGKEVSGVVEDLSIRITQLRDLDGNLHTVANGASTIVTNRSFGFANVNIDINVAYDTDFEKARDIINQVGLEQAASEQWRESVLEPIKFLRVDSFNEWSVTLKAVGKVTPASQWDLAGDFRLRIKKAFDQNHVQIPLRQLVVHQAPDKK